MKQFVNFAIIGPLLIGSRVSANDSFTSLSAFAERYCIQGLGDLSPKNKKIKAVEHAVLGNLGDAKILISNESGFVKKIEIIESATPGSRLDLAYFIFEDDYTSSYMAQKLIEKAKQGVQIRILVDYFMSEKLTDFFGHLASQPNIEVRRFRPPTPKFIEFLKQDLDMASTDLFFRGINLYNPKLLLQAIQNSKLSHLVQSAHELLESASVNASTDSDALKTNLILAMMLDPKQSKLAKKRTLLFHRHLGTYLRRMHHKILLHTNGTHVEFVVDGRNVSDEYNLSSGHPLLKGRNYPIRYP